MIKLKNVYDAPSHEDGERILIERLWPPEADVYLFRIDRWMKDLAPSYDLLEWLREHPKEWPKFKEDYLRELQDPQKQAWIKELARRGREVDLTLLYRHGNVERSPAAIIYEILCEREKTI